MCHFLNTCLMKTPVAQMYLGRMMIPPPFLTFNPLSPCSPHLSFTQDRLQPVAFGEVDVRFVLPSLRLAAS